MTAWTCVSSKSYVLGWNGCRLTGATAEGAQDAMDIREDGLPGVGVKLRNDDGGPRTRGAVDVRGKDGVSEARGTVILLYALWRGRSGVCSTSIESVSVRLRERDIRDIGLDTGIREGVTRDGEAVGRANTRRSVELGMPRIAPKLDFRPMAGVVGTPSGRVELCVVLDETDPR